MTQPINLAVLGVATVVRAVSGIAQAFDYPPDQPNYSPFTVTYVSDGDLAAGPEGTRRDLLNIATDLLLPYTMKLDDAIQTLTPFLDTIPQAFLAEVSGAGARFGGTITTFANTHISFIPKTDYAGVEMRGYQFVMQGVKILVPT